MLFAPVFVKVLANEKSLFTVLAIGPSILFVATGGVARGYLSARRRLFPIAVSQVIEACLKLVIGIAFARLGAKLNLDVKYISAMAILGISIGSAISTLYLIICAKTRHKCDNSGQRLQLDKRKINVEIFRIALPITLGSSVLTFASVIDVGLITRGLRSSGISEGTANEMYGNYSTLAVPMINLLLSLVTPLTVALLPRLIDAKLKSDEREFEAVLNKTALYTSVFVCPCAAIFYFYSFDVLDILFSSTQAANGYELLAVLSFGVSFLALLNVVNTAHEALGNFKITISSILVAVITKILLSILFLTTTSLKLIAIPLCTSLSNFLAFIFSYLALRRCGIRMSLFKTLLLPLLLSAVCIGVPYYCVFKSGILGGGFLYLCLAICLSLTVYMLFVLPILRSTHNEKCKFRQKNQVA